jgi:hypothetical protein
VPGGGIEAFEAELIDGGKLREHRCTLERGDGERAHLPTLDMRHDRGRGRKHHLHVARDHILQRRRRAFVWHVHDIDLGLRLEQLGGEMRGRAMAGGGIVDLAGISLGSSDQLGHRAHRQLRD